MRTYWMFWDDMAVIDRVFVEGGHIVIPQTYQRQSLEPLHVNHIEIKKTKLSPCKSIHWIGTNMDTGNHIKIALHVLIFSKCSQRKKIIHHEIPGKPWQVVGVDKFTLHNKNYLCIADFHSKFPVIKKDGTPISSSLILACKLNFSEYGLPKKIVSDAGGNFI